MRMLKTKTQYLIFALIANGLCSCSYLNLGASSPQTQLANFIEDSPSVYLSRPKDTKTISTAHQQSIAQQLAANDKKQREKLSAQQDGNYIASGNKSQLPQIQTPEHTQHTQPRPTDMQPITPEIAVGAPQLNADWRGAADFSRNYAPSSEGGTTSPILNLTDMRHPKTPGLNTSHEEEDSMESNKAPRPNQAELRGYRSPQLKNTIPLPYKSN